MQQDASGSTKSELSSGVPPVGSERDDSGLHDIRNLAQSTKQRISSRRVSTHPPHSRSDEDVLASSSASWKNLALPQPAKMVSLPELDELPSKHDIHTQEKAAKAAAKHAAREAKAEAKAEAKFEAQSVIASSGSAVAPSAADSASTDFKPAFSQYGAPKARASHKGRNLALVGMGLAAAAGVTIFFVTQNNAADKSTAQMSAPAAQAPSLADKTRALDEATATLQARHAAAEAQAVAAPDTGAAAPAPVVEETKDSATEDRAKFAAPPPAKAAKHTVTKSKGAAVKTDDTPAKPEAKVEQPVKKQKPEPGDPDFDTLLKEAGVDQKKNDKPKLDKKQLSGDDFKKGMAAIQGKAQACFKGTQGTAAVKLTVAPSGQVSKVTVGGVFAGKPEADCVAAAVKSAQFPAWDGGPQSFGYPILLSE